ncbi:hypothetical protein BOX15_Mlig021906g5 [Macrostomum lignano]|uniref:Uncharacterized protein n=1 Tax=Macrostomum lignano TaxID=282301 RepID=A0A267DFB9_9PLAT|nr:hypothetical protein BOX15_Mlig021906g5 [Macrostomum lignano]
MSSGIDKALRQVINDVYTACKQKEQQAADASADNSPVGMDSAAVQEKLQFLECYLNSDTNSLSNRCKAGSAFIALKKHYLGCNLSKALEYFACSALPMQICLIQGLVTAHEPSLTEESADILLETLYSGLKQQDLVFHCLTCLLSLLSLGESAATPPAPAEAAGGSQQQQRNFFTAPAVLQSILRRLLGFWDSPLYFVPNLTVKIFHCIVANWSTDSGSPNPALAAFIDELWTMPMLCRGALRFWSALVPLLDEIRIIGLCSRLVDALDVNYTASAAASLFGVIAGALTQRGKTDLLAQIFPDMCHRMRHMSQLSQRNFCSLILPVYIASDTSFNFSARELPDGNNPHGNFFDIQCWCSVAKHCKLRGRLPRMRMADLRMALIHCDEQTRAAALEVLCLSNKPTCHITPQSLKMILEFFCLNMNSDQPPFRQRLLACFRSVCQQVKDGCIQALPELSTRLAAEPPAELAAAEGAEEYDDGGGASRLVHCLLPDISVATRIAQFDAIVSSAAVIGANSGDKTDSAEEFLVFEDDPSKTSPDALLSNVKLLAQFVRQLLDSDVWFPGACYQRQRTCIEYLQIACTHYFGSSSGMKKRGYPSEVLDKVTEFLREAFRRFGAPMDGPEAAERVVGRLLRSALHCSRDIQDSMLGLLTEHYPMARLPQAGPASLDRLLPLLLRRCHSPDAEQFHGAGRVLAYLLANSAVHVGGAEPLRYCLDAVAAALAKAKAEPAAAASECTGHGYLLAAGLYLSRGGGEVNRGPDVQRQLFNEATALCFDLIASLMSVMGFRGGGGEGGGEVADWSADAAPSFEELGRAIEKAAGVDADLDEDLLSGARLSPHYQRILAWAWRNLAMAADLLVQLCAAHLRAADADIDLDGVRRVGRRLAAVVTGSRHRGTIEAVANSLREFCQLIRWRQELADLPGELVNAPLVAMETASYSVTRRSAGLPLLLTSVLSAVCAGQWSEPLLDRTVARLLRCVESATADKATAEDEAKGSDKVDSPKVHALNLLRAVVREAALYNATTRHHEAITRATLTNFSDRSWAVRNACVQLLGALSQRMLGVGRPHITPTEFFSAYPRLQRCFLEVLVRGANPSSAKFIAHQATVPVLSFLSQLSPDPPTALLDNVEPFRQPLVTLLSSPVYAIRLMAAKSLVSFAPPKVRLDLLSAQVHNLSSLHRSANSLHGHILLCQRLALGLSGHQDLSVILSVIVDLLLVLITFKSWFLARESLRLLRLLMKRHDPGVSLNLPNSLAPTGKAAPPDIFFDMFDQELTELSMEHPNIFENVRWDPGYLFKSLAASSEETTQHFLTQQDQLKEQRMKLALSGRRGVTEDMPKAVCSPQDLIDYAIGQPPEQCLTSNLAVRVLAMLVTYNQGFFATGYLKEYLAFISDQLRQLPSDCPSERFSSLILLQSHLVNTLFDKAACQDLLAYLNRFSDYSISEDLRLSAANALLILVSGRLWAQSRAQTEDERVREILFRMLFDESTAVRVLACSIVYRCGWLPALSHHRISGLALTHPIVARPAGAKELDAGTDCDWLVRTLAGLVQRMSTACRLRLRECHQQTMYQREEANIFVEWRYLIELCFYKLYLSAPTLDKQERARIGESLADIRVQLANASARGDSAEAAWPSSLVDSAVMEHSAPFHAMLYAGRLCDLLIGQLC